MVATPSRRYLGRSLGYSRNMGGCQCSKRGCQCRKKGCLPIRTLCKLWMLKTTQYGSNNRARGVGRWWFSSIVVILARVLVKVRLGIMASRMLRRLTFAVPKYLAACRAVTILPPNILQVRDKPGMEKFVAKVIDVRTNGGRGFNTRRQNGGLHQPETPGSY